MDFEYSALDINRKVIRGYATAESASMLVGQLKKEGLIPQAIKSTSAEIAAKKRRKSIFYNRSVSGKELVIFTRQLSSCLNAGLLITDALETIKDDSENLYFRNVLNGILETVRSGLSFSGALIKYPNLFSEAFVAMAKVGEESGRLDIALDNLSKYMEDTERIKDKINSALRYPLFVLGFFFLVVFIIVFFIVPKFKAMFLHAGAKLPLVTLIVVGISEFIMKNFLWVIFGVVFAVLAIWFLTKLPKAALVFDAIKFKIPVLGKIFKKVAISRLCWTMAILLSGGISLITALKIGSEVNNNAYLKNIIMKIRANLMGGHTLSNEIRKELFFPSMIVKMVQVGEKSGKIADMLQRSADYYSQETEKSVQDITALIEPVLIILIGGLVLITVLALYLPIFRISMVVR